MIYVNNTKEVCRLAEIEKAVAYIRANGATAEDGKVELDGKKVYISFQSYESKDRKDCKYESHKNYIDVQYVIAGEEVMVVTDKAGLKEKAPYNAEKDVVFYEDGKAGTELVLKAGDYIVVYPEDVHMPKVQHGTPCAVKKAVAKILI
jgi:YhcH/YjgK/YiaL family protein